MRSVLPTVGRAVYPIVILLGVAMTGLQPSHLQSASTQQRRMVDTVKLATITTDTGALSPGNRDFSRFSTPGMCLGAVGIAEDAGSRAIDTQIQQVFQDSTLQGNALPDNAVRVASACVARFTVATTVSSDLPDLFTLALMAGNDSLAHAVIAKRMAAATTITERAAILQSTASIYLKAKPVRIAAVETTLTQLDALGTQVQGARIDGHTLLLMHMMAKYNVSGMRSEAERIIALGRAVPVKTIQLQKGELFAAYAALSSAAYIDYPDSVMLIATRAKEDLGRFGAMPPGMSVTNPILLADFSTMSVTRVRDALLPYNADHYAGRTLPPMNASYWFPRAPSSWPPGNGRASLVIYGGWLVNSCARTDWFLFTLAQVKRPECGALYTYLPHWGKQYGAGLSITLVSQTAENAARSVELSPAAEADSLKWFFLDHLQLPVTLGVVVDSVWRLAPIDGRRFQADTTFYATLLDRVGPNNDSNLIVLLYGEHGTLRYVGDFNVPVLRALLDRTLGTTVPPLSKQP